MLTQRIQTERERKKTRKKTKQNAAVWIGNDCLIFFFYCNILFYLMSIDGLRIYPQLLIPSLELKKPQIHYLVKAGSPFASPIHGAK